jgi:hypothetical protein
VTTGSLAGCLQLFDAEQDGTETDTPLGEENETDGQSGKTEIDETDGPEDETRRGPADSTAWKTRSTIYTQKKVSTARSNIEKFHWANEQKSQITSKADTVLDDFDLDELWQYVTGQNVPRALSVDSTHQVGSPTHGPEIYDSYGPYPWILDPHDEPWKVKDPLTGMKYPTNDFQSYLESGRDERGFFDPAIADDRYLVNELYPERGEKWGVDDGYGWVNENGKRFVFVAYYNHWAVWTALEELEDRNWLSIHEMARVLGLSYVFTGEQRYARAAAVLLDRIADVYPAMNLEPYQAGNGFVNSHGGTGKGKILGSIWEHRIVDDLLDCYDAIFPAVENDDRLVSFLEKKAEEYTIGQKSTSAQIRENIERNLVREIFPAVKNAQIRGNFGYHQSILAKAAVVLNEPDGYTREALDFVFRAGGLERDSDNDFIVTGGNILPQLVNVIDRDGHNNEASPLYNSIPIKEIRPIADILDGYDNYERISLYEHLSVEKLHESQIPLTMLNGRYQPNIGDNKQTGEPGLQIGTEILTDGFSRYDDSTFAQMAYLLKDNSADGIRSDIFSPNPEQVRDDVKNVIEAEGPLDLPSQTLAGYGFTALRDGSPPSTDTDGSQRAVWLYYGRSQGSHAHRDTLNLGVFAHGLNLAPDLGYPERTGGWPKRHNWTANTISHNTVVVNKQPQKPQWVSCPRGFDETERVQLIDVEALDIYPETDQYRRTTAMIRIDDVDSYAVDFFRVDGGDNHHFSFHGAGDAVTTSGLELETQESGTYAGENVSKPGRGEDTEFNRSVGNGFNYLYNVRFDENPANKFSVDWDVVDMWNVREADSGVHLRLTMFGDIDDVALADGDPPQNPDSPETLKYLLAHCTGSDIRTTFTSVIEPYMNSRSISSIDTVPVTSNTARAKALKVSLDSGRTDYIVSTTDTDSVYRVGNVVEFSGSFAVYSEENGEPQYAYLYEGTYLRTRTDTPVIQQLVPRYEGELVDFTRELHHENELIVELTNKPNGEPEEELVGEWIFIETDTERNGAYEIHGVSADQGRLILDIGKQTPVKSYTESKDLDFGYEYIIESGSSCRIPLSRSWSRSGRDSS